MFKSNLFLIPSIIFLFISSCSNVVTSTNSMASTATIQISTSTPTNAPTLVPTEIVSTLTPSVPESILKFQPFEIKAELPSNVRSTEALVICNDTSISLLRFIPDIKLEPLTENIGDVFCYPTSPDGKWIAYDQESKESPTGSWLIVQSIDGRQKKIAEDQNWLSFGDYVWLDNQHLFFNNFIDPPDVQRLRTDPTYSVVIVNPFSGEHIELSSNYPGLTLPMTGPLGAMSFNYSDVVYNPSLDLVIFPAWGGAHNYIVLWDRRSKAILAKVETLSGAFGDYPLWSPDATQFAVPAVTVMNEQNMTEEWYRVSREGQVEQLTHFGDYFSNSYIGSASNWSPDGQKLAFWLDLNPSPCPSLHLAVLDITTKQVIDTCLPGTRDYAPPPIWSSDSRYIVLRDASGPQIRTILVDLENDQAFDIATLVGESPPVGWMISP